jgi:nucleotide-binding universal stress UspA family protein
MLVTNQQSEEKEGIENRTAFDKKLRAFYKIPEEIQHEYTISEGTQPSLEILNQSREKDIDLMVMGSHTTVEDKRWYVGSTVEEVSRQCICPVAIVTHHEAFLKIEK